MPKVTFVKAAQKDVPGSDIKAGESYYWWKFRFGGKQVSRTYPKRAQLTQSDFLQQLYEIEEIAENFEANDKDEFENNRQDLLDLIENLRFECEEKLSNMPEHLQESSASGELLRERMEALEQWYNEIESVGCDVEDETMREEILAEEEELSEEEMIEAIAERREGTLDIACIEIQNTSSGL